MKRNILYEILRTRFYMMEESALHDFRSAIKSNIVSHIQFEQDDSRRGGAILRYSASKGRVLEKNYVATGPYCMEWMADEMEADDKLVNIIDVCGPITRGGGACSYGSVDIRDWMIQASRIEGCIADVIYIDSPGGCVGCENDFKQGVQAAHDAGQRVIAIVDGMAASMAYYYASLCDEVWAFNPKHEVGCVGCLISYFDIADGVENAVTHEKYVEMYATQSVDKNKVFRDVSNGDREEMQKMLDGHAQDFMDDVKASRPNVTDDQLTGKMYPAGEVLGSMVDRIGTLDELLCELFGIEEQKPSGEGEQAPAQEPDNTPHEEVEEKTENQNNRIMENYGKLAGLCGVQGFEQDEQGNICFVPSMAEHAEQELEKKDEMIATLNLSCKQHSQNYENMKAELEKQVGELNKSIEEQKKASDEAAASAAAEVDELKKQLQQANETIAQQEKDIEEMSHAPKAPDMPSAPKDNATAEKKKDFCPFDPEASLDEQRAQMQAWRAKIRRG